VKLTGDGMLAEFGSAVDALRAAIDFQQAVAEANRAKREHERVVFRIGLHLGDLIVDGDDLYGDGVNVAARLETEAPPGGIVVSGAFHEATNGRVAAGFEDLGRLTLKNIDRQIQAYRVTWGDNQANRPLQPGENPAAVPSVVPESRLPSQDMSGEHARPYSEQLQLEPPAGHDPAAPLVALPAGTMLRGYQVVSILGEGTFGITYLARDTTLGRDVAIKEYLPAALAVRRHDCTVLPRSTASLEDFVWGRERFLDEARTLAKLDGVPGVVRVIDFLEANGTAYMVMGLVRGETLRQRMHRVGALSAHDVNRLLVPLLDGLEHVHAAGYLHRDIKPSNIILDGKDLPTLIDFGASRVAMADRTTAMTAVYTPGYAAPEQFVSMKQGPWTDIYGLSATLYHAITGTQPPSAMERTLEDNYKPLVDLAPAGFARHLLAAIDTGLAVRPAERPQTIAAWRDLMRNAAPRSDTVMVRRPEVAAPTATGAPPRSDPPASATGKSRRSLWLGVAATVLAFSAGGYYAYAAFEEKRQAEVAALETRKREQEAQRQAEIEASKKAVEAAARQQRERDAAQAKLRAETEARRRTEEAQRQQAQKAAEEAARRQQAEAAAARKREEETRKLNEESAKNLAANEARTKAEEEARRQPAGTADPESTVAPIDRALRDWMAKHGVKQASIAVMREDRLVFAKGYNGRNAGDRINIWGLSHAITGLCVAALIGEGKLRLDDKLGKVLQPIYARVRRPADPRVDDIRVSDLLTHRSGWHRSGWVGKFTDGYVPGLWLTLQRVPFQSVSSDVVMSLILAQPLAEPPGDKPAPAALNYFVLGKVIEAAAGEPYAEACAKRVVAPAGVSGARLDPTWGRITEGAAGWSISGPEFLAVLRLYRARQPDLLTPEMRRWMWDGEHKWRDDKRDAAYSLGMTARPATRDLWTFGDWHWQQPDAHGGPISVKQGTAAALLGDGTGWFVSFDTVTWTSEPKAIQELEATLRDAHKAIKSWPEVDRFTGYSVGPVSINDARIKAEEAARRQQVEAAAARKREEETRKLNEESAKKLAANEARAKAEEEARRQQAGTADPESTVAPFDRAMRDWMAKHNVKQASIAVMREDRLVLAKAYNGRNVAERINVWGLSRGITGLCAAVLIAEGKLRLDDKIGKLRRHPPPEDGRVDDIRIQDLLTERSGFPRRFEDNFLAPGVLQLLKRTPLQTATAEMLAPGIYGQKLVAQPGSRYESSNLNYFMLGNLIEAVTGLTYADACALRVLEPAGVSRAKLDPVWGGLVQGVGGWSLSAPEYLAFLRLHRPREPDILTPELRRWMWDGNGKWTNDERQIATALGVTTRPASRDLWAFSDWDWRQWDAAGGPILVKQWTYAALADDGTGWFVSFDAAPWGGDPNAVRELEAAMWDARKAIKIWPQTDDFARYKVRPVSIKRATGSRN
jgi:CubicO group peptidase (beta-lactamase class C family)/serine/threonine protein kinase